MSTSKAAMFGLLAVSAAHGNIITPGTFLGTPDNFTGQTGLVPTNTLAISLAIPTANFSATVTFAVVRDPNNVFGAGDLDFLYQVANNAFSTTSLNFLGGSAFNGFSTDVGYRTDGTSLLGGGVFANGSVSPIGVSSSAAVGGVVSFDFQSPGTTIAPGQTSTVLVVATNANNFAFGSGAPQALVLVSDGSIETTVGAFEPTAVPEPGSMLLLFGGGVVMAGLKRFRR